VRRKDHLSFQDLLVQTLGVVIFKRKKATEHSVEDHSTRPEVGFDPCILVAFDQLRSGVTGRATCCFKFLPLLVSVREPEINQFEVLSLIQQNVFRLDIPVSDALLSDIVDSSN
jgi:hypothetical protein